MVVIMGYDCEWRLVKGMDMKTGVVTVDGNWCSDFIESRKLSCSDFDAYHGLVEFLS